MKSVAIAAVFWAVSFCIVTTQRLRDPETPAILDDTKVGWR